MLTDPLHDALAMTRSQTVPRHAVNRPVPCRPQCSAALSHPVSQLHGVVHVRPTTPRVPRSGTPCVSGNAATVLAYAETMGSRADWASEPSGEQDEAVRQLIALGEEKGYLLRDEIDARLPVDVTASAVLDDLLNQRRDADIDVDSESLERAGTRLARMDADEPDPTPSRPDSSSDVVRVYLAEMGRVPLLTRDEEVALAKRIERGHRTVMVAISHTPSLVQQVMRLGGALRENERLIRRLVTHRHGDVTVTRLKRRARQVRVQIKAVEAAWADAHIQHAVWQRVPIRHRRIAQRAQWNARRAGARVAQLMRRISFSDAARHDLIEGFRVSAAKVASAQREVDVIEQQLRQRTTRTRLTGTPRLQEAKAALAHLTEPLQQTPAAVRRTLEKIARARRRPNRRRTRWSRPTFVWSCRSPRSTPPAACPFWTSFRKATSG